MTVLAALPFAAGALLFAHLRRRPMEWRTAALGAAVAWGAVLTVLSEVLSLAGAFHATGLSLGWGAIVAGLAAALYRGGGRPGGRPTSPEPSLPRWDRVLVGCVAAVGAVTAVVALLSAPSTGDSMSYHLPRVLQWAQSGSLRHFPTPYLPQLFQPPLAELAIAHLYVLGGGDRLSNLVQWLAMSGSIVGVSLIAREIGASSRGQVLAAVFAATLPMGIAQASSCQNDYAVAFWLVCLAAFGLRLLGRGTAEGRGSPARWLELGAAGSLGLAILTKGSAYVFALPLVAWIGWRLLRDRGWRALLPGARIAAVALLLNAGHFARNAALFRSPVAGTESSTPDGALNGVLGPAVFASNLLRGITLHMGTPFPRVNAGLYDLVARAHVPLGLDVSDPRTTAWGTFTIQPLTTDEDNAGCPLHALLIAVAIGLFAARSRKAFPRPGGPYLLALLAAIALWCVLLRWQPWSSRHHLPLFVLFSGFVGYALEGALSRRVTAGLAALLLVASLPWLLLKKQGLLLPVPAGWTQSPHRTVFAESRWDQYFKNVHARGLEEPYLGAARFLREQRVERVALGLARAPWEYQLWVALRREIPASRIHHALVGNASAALAGPRPAGSEAQALICVQGSASNPAAPSPCGDRSRTAIALDGRLLERRWSMGPVDVFLSSSR